MKLILSIGIVSLALTATAQVRTSGGGTVITKIGSSTEVTARNFKPQLLTEDDSPEKKLKVLGQYLAHMEYRCGLRRTIPKDLTILDSYYNLAYGLEIPTASQIGNLELCHRSERVNSCLVKKGPTLNKIMTVVNKDKAVPTLIQKQLKIDRETTMLLLEFFTKQGQLKNK